MSTSVTIGIHTDDDIGVEYHDSNNVSWVWVTAEHSPPVAIYGPPERLRRLFTEALAAIPEPDREPAVVEQIEEHSDMATVAS